MRISGKSWTTFCRDRIAPTCTIRHPVRPIVALQRRMRFYARLAGFCRDRCHQRRARRAERASFSGFVSNPDFRVPCLRPNRRTGADLAVRPPRRSHPSDPESRPGLSRRSWPSTFWSRCSPGLLDVHLCPGLDPGSRSSPESVASRFWTLFPRAYRGPRIAGRNARAKSTLDRLFAEHKGLFGGTMPSRLRVVDQINMVYAYVVGSTAPPTQDQRRMTRQGAERLQELVSELTRLSQEALPALHRKLDQHRVPWTPGRPVRSTGEPNS